jgi:hypothetical protein
MPLLVDRGDGQFESRWMVVDRQQMVGLSPEQPSLVASKQQAAAAQWERDCLKFTAEKEQAQAEFARKQLVASAEQPGAGVP